MRGIFFLFFALAILSGCVYAPASTIQGSASITSAHSTQDFSGETSTDTIETLREHNQEQQRATNQHENVAPTITITEPDLGERVSSSALIGWKATDGNNDQLLISLEYRAEGGEWVYEADRIENDGVMNWDTSNLGNGVYEIRLSATDGVEVSSSIRLFEIVR